MAKGKTTYQAGRSESGLQHYVYAVQKKNLPAGEKLVLNKYDKKLRKHVPHTFKDVK
jgi:ribosomal protein L33